MSILRPPPRQKLSEWIEKEVSLPDTVSSLPGKVRLAPYQREIADAISDPAIERVTVVKPVRVGFTTLLTSAIGSFISNEPSPIMVVLPTEDDCRDYLVSDIEPIFSETPCLSKVLGDEVAEGKRNTMLSKRFPGGSLKIVSAKSPRNLRRHNTRVLFIDEADAMETTKEGSPILLAEKRTLSFANRKIVIGSTPVDAQTSNVLAKYEQSDKRIFECQCPECGEFNEIKWKDIIWPENEPEKAEYCCPHCGSLISETYKSQMVVNGRWRITAPENYGHAGFKLNALISPLANASWGKLATEFIQAKKDPEDLRQFINTILAEGTGDSSHDLDEVELYENRSDFSIQNIPADVLALTAGVDVQHDRLEVTLVGWTREGFPKVLYHKVIWSHWHAPETWSDLNDLLSQKWKHPFGGLIGIDAVAIDAGDGTTMDTVLDFCAPRSRNRIMAIKGAGGTRPWIQRSITNKKPLWIVGIDGIKTSIFDRCSNGKIEFGNLELNWFEQLLGERSVIRYKRGRPHREFIPVRGRRNEALDCVVYAFAAHKILNVNWEKRISLLQNKTSAKTRTREIRSNWLAS